MLELEFIKKENETLKSQLAANSQGIHGLLAELDAHKGELADSRVISMQLRKNLILVQKSNEELTQKIKLLETKILDFQTKLKYEAPLVTVPPELKELEQT